MLVEVQQSCESWDNGKGSQFAVVGSVACMSKWGTRGVVGLHEDGRGYPIYCCDHSTRAMETQLSSACDEMIHPIVRLFGNDS